MPGTRSELALQRLAGLREQRRAALLSDELLRDRIRAAVGDAQALAIPVAEIARALGIERSSLYRTYLNGA